MTIQPEEPPKRAAKAAAIFAALEAAEQRVSAAVDKGVKRFLNRAKDVATLGEMYGWWVKEVDDQISDAIRQVWLEAHNVYAGPFTVSSLDGLDVYMSQVKDRLVRGLEPPLPEAAFDQVRIAITTGAANGWSTQQTAQDIAARLNWEKDGDYWRAQKAAADDRIDSILDRLGEPGAPAREWARMHDPTVQVLRDQRNLATRHLDAEHSYWADRAVKITRTESTGAFNAAALGALHDEGWAYKEWLATPDARTRASHRAASGQRVRLGSPFRVGDALLMMPGDPTGTPDEVINCRCVIIGTDDKPSALSLVAAGHYNPYQARVPKGNGRLSGRWIPTPTAIMNTLTGAFTDDQVRALTQEAMTAHDKAAGILSAYGTDGVEFGNTKAIKEAANVLRPIKLPAFQRATQDLDDFASVDWYSDPDNPPPVPKTAESVATALPAGWTAQPQALTHPSVVFRGPHGHTVRFEKPGDFTETEQYGFVTKVDGLLKEGAKATNLVDLRPVNVDVQGHDQFLAGVGEDLGTLEAEGVAAYVQPGTDPDTIRVHPFTVTQVADMTGRSELPARTEDHLPFAQSTITHELGHVVGERTPNFKGDQGMAETPLFKEVVRTSHLGDYAKSSPPEAFAEAWLEWVADHSTNTTHSDASKLAAKYAKEYGWGWTP